MTVSGVDSVEVRVHLYERSFPAKPVSRVHVRRKQQRHRTRHARLTRRCHGSSAVLPDDSDTHPGRERPPRIEARDRVRGWQRGSLTPQMPPSLLLTAALDCDAGGTERRPLHRSEVATSQRTSPNSTRLATTLTPPRAWQRTARQGGGTLLPRLCSPSPFLLSFKVGYCATPGVKIEDVREASELGSRSAYPDLPTWVRRVAPELERTGPLSRRTYGRRQPYRHEQIGRIELTLAGFVDDRTYPSRAASRSGRIRESFRASRSSIPLSSTHNAIDGDPWLNHHDVPSKKRSIFRPRLPTP